MSEADIDLENRARELHRRKCYSAGIRDEAKIANYWEGCDRSMYRRKASLPTPPATGRG